jgi:hypothetical protein
VDIDDYINSLIRENENLKSLVKSLKDEIRIQRKEIAVLRDERSIIFESERGPNTIITEI